MADKFDPAKVVTEYQHDPSVLDSVKDKDLQALADYAADPEVEGSVHIRAAVATRLHAYQVETANEDTEE